MTFFEYFYWKAYKWYNRTGDESYDTLRGSAIALLSLFQVLNFFSLIFLWGIVIRHTYLNKYEGGGSVLLAVIYNFRRFNYDRHKRIVEAVGQMSPEERKRRNTNFVVFVTITSALLVFSLIAVAIVKKKTGNYDL